MGLFGRAQFLDAEDETWHLDTWGWFLKSFGGLDRLRRSPMVKATAEFFPATEATGEARAAHIFERIKTLADMGDWPCTLLAQPERPRGHLGVGYLASEKGRPLGTFAVRGDEVSISYDPASLERPVELVATFIHELAHYRLARLHEDGPGGHDMHEYATDLMTVFLGFGLFGANRAFNFKGNRYGWESSQQGYLRERDWVFALAVFLSLRNETPQAVKNSLKSHLYSGLKSAARYLARNDRLLAPLRES